MSDLERIWDQMYSSTLFYGRRGPVLNAISGVDLALYDLLGKVRDEPVYALLGGPVRDEIAFYATGPRPDLARELGFLGGKVPLLWAAADGPDARDGDRTAARPARPGRPGLLADAGLLDIADAARCGRTGRRHA